MKNRINMKNILITAILMFAVTFTYAQQEQQYTQFMYNKLGYNPGYAGSHDAACITGIYRNQWLGLEGAPQTQALSFNMPLRNKRVGVGVNLNHNTIGISETWTLDGAYSYRIPAGSGYLGLGLQGSIRSLRNDYNDPRLVSTVPSILDGSVPTGERSKLVPNFGVGLYYNTQTFYIGLSVPRIISNNIDFNDVGSIIGKEVNHVYLMTGFMLKVTDNIHLNPQILLKYADNSPFDADLNLTALFNNKFSAGLTYRVGGSTVTGAGESIDLMIGAQITDEVLLGLSYDISLSDLKDYNDGSIELALRYCFGKSEGENFMNPRFF